MRLRTCFALLAALLSLGFSASAQPKKLKVYISVDMEGVVGAVTGDQLGPGGFEYQRFREFMTREALAAVNAAKEAGATEIVEPSCGLLVPPGDEVALASALHRLVTDVNLRTRLGNAGPQRAGILCDPARQLSRISELLSSVAPFQLSSVSH